jgi:Domain of unknown function (DUF6798)
MRRLALPIALAVVAALALYGYAFELGTENQPLQIPVIERRLDPGLYPGDPLVETLDRYPSEFFPLAAAVRAQMPLERPFFVLHLLTLVGVATGMGALARRLGAGGMGVALAALLVLASPVIRPALLSRDTMVAHWVTPTTIAFPILLLALGCLIAGRAGWAGIVAGLATHLHVVGAGLFMGVAIPATMIDRGIGRTARLILAWVLVSLPILARLPAGALSGPSDPEFMALLRSYYPYHFFPSAEPRAVWVRLLILTAAAWFALGTLPRSPAGARIRRTVIAVLIPIAIGSIFAELWPSAAVTKLHLLRADRWFYVLLMAGLGVAATAPARDVQDSRARWLGLGLLAMAAGVLRGAYPLVAWGVVIAGLARFSNRRAIALPLGWIATGVALLHLASWKLAITALLLSGLAVAACVPALGRRVLHAPTLRAAVIVLALIELMGSAPTRGPAGFQFARPAFAPDWREIQDWAASATPKTARFLTPPRPGGFRVYGRRAAVVEWKDGAAMLWTPGFGPGWQARIKDVEQALAARDTTVLFGTARRYGADYAVVERAHLPPGARPVHQNAAFVVLQVHP